MKYVEKSTMRLNNYQNFNKTLLSNYFEVLIKYLGKKKAKLYLSYNTTCYNQSITFIDIKCWI